MIIGDPSHMARLERIGVNLLDEENLDTSFGALSALITQEVANVEQLPLPEGDGNA